MQKRMVYCLCSLMLLLPALLSGQMIEDTLRIDGSNGVRPLVESLSEAFQKEYPGIKIFIGKGMSTKARISALQEESIDIAMASHGLDIPAFTKQGLQVHWFAQMAIVLGVHESVNLKGLSTDQLCEIYQGKYDNWEQLGGNDLPIKALARPSDEVDTEVLMEKLSCFAGIDGRTHLEFHQKSGPLARALAEKQGAIGMTAAVRVAQSEGSIKPLRIDGIKPKPSKVFKGEYPFSRNAYLIVKGTPTPAIKRFLMFIKSKTGKKVLQQNAAVPSR